MSTKSDTVHFVRMLLKNALMTSFISVGDFILANTMKLKSFLALTCLTEFVKKNPIKAAPLLPVILTQFSYRALESNIQLSQIARHLLRAIYQQLRPHKVMCTVFCAKLPENVFITLGQV